MGKFFEWEPSLLGIGVVEMDREHQVLLRHMNVLFDLWSAHAPRDQLGRALGDLAAFTQTHFAHEEAYMTRIGYPGLSAHQKIHRDLLARVTAFKADFDRTGQLGESFFGFLKVWLKAHICGLDTRYADHRKSA